MNNFFWSWSIPQRSLFLRNSILSISMLSNHRDRSKMFFFHLNDQTSLYRWSCWNTSCQLNSRTFTLDFTCYCFGLLRTTKFPRVTIENKYHVSIVELTIQNLKSEVAELVRWPRTLIKIFYFSGEQHFFQNSPEIKSRYDRVQKRFYLLAKEGYFGTEETVSANLLTGQATRAHLTGALGQGVRKGAKWVS